MIISRSSRRPILTSLIGKYTLKEFTGPFSFCVLGFTVILLSGLLFELTDLIFVKNVPTITVARMLLYKVPGMMVMTLPIAVLFSTLLALGRLSADSELTVMRASGLAFKTIIIPIITAGLAISMLTYVANEQVVPWANHKFENTLRQIIFEEGLPAVQENVFFRGTENRYFYIQRINSRTNELEHVMVYELEKGAAYPRLITAQRGLYHENNWVLYDGIMQEMDKEGFVEYEARFQSMEIVTDQDAEIYLGNQKTTDEMNRRELREHIERFQRGGLKVRSFVVDYHLKIAMPMASFIFALFGAPLSLKSKGGRSFGIAVSIVVTFLYYVATSVARSLGVNGVLSPVLAAWLTNGLFFVAGVWLILRSDKLR